MVVSYFANIPFVFCLPLSCLLFPYEGEQSLSLVLGTYSEVECVWFVQETTPLAGSSAGAIVCAVIASGASMEEALQATKILAEDCRNRGTAFRLGVFLYSCISTQQ